MPWELIGLGGVMWKGCCHISRFRKKFSSVTCHWCRLLFLDLFTFLFIFVWSTLLLSHTTVLLLIYHLAGDNLEDPRVPVQRCHSSPEMSEGAVVGGEESSPPCEYRPPASPTPASPLPEMSPSPPPLSRAKLSPRWVKAELNCVCLFCVYFLSLKLGLQFILINIRIWIFILIYLASWNVHNHNTKHEVISDTFFLP